MTSKFCLLTKYWLAARTASGTGKALNCLKLMPQTPSISVLGYCRTKTRFCGEFYPGVQFVVQEYLLNLGLNMPYPKPVDEELPL